MSGLVYVESNRESTIYALPHFDINTAPSGDNIIVLTAGGIRKSFDNCLHCAIIDHA